MKREAALQAMARHDISQRRACRLVSVDPKTVRREPEPDSPAIRVRMREVASERRRFGYRRIGLMLRREGITMNHKKLRRLYREEGLAVKRRRGRKRATGTREPMQLPTGPSKRWSLDFVADTFGVSRRFRILAVIDDFTRECLALVADTSLCGRRVARELDAVIRLYGRPDLVVSDNGLTSRAILEWQNESGVGWLHRAGQAAAERLHRELQRPAARRTPERGGVRQSWPRPQGAGQLAAGLQLRASPLGPWRHPASGRAWVVRATGGLNAPGARKLNEDEL
jgi:transposase InsO family protein